MSKKICLFSLVLLSLAFVSCKETEEATRYDNWKARNEAFIDSLENVYETMPDRGGLGRFELITDPSRFMYYKVKKAVETDALNETAAKEGWKPTAGSTVSVYYKGVNILGERFDGFAGEDPNIGAGASEAETIPYSSELSSLVTGWQEALQRMKVGERWMIYVPWDLGYGDKDKTDSNGKTMIYAYSDLIFDIQLLDTDFPVIDTE